jgi:hypothetical protein
VVQLELERGIIAHAECEEIHWRPEGAGNEEDFIGVHLDSEPSPLALNPSQFDTLHLPARRS